MYIEHASMRFGISWELNPEVTKTMKTTKIKLMHNICRGVPTAGRKGRRERDRIKERK